MHHTFWKTAWQLLDADESYIRASSVRVIGIILEKDELREIFVQDFSLVCFIELASFVSHFYNAFRNMKLFGRAGYFEIGFSMPDSQNETSTLTVYASFLVTENHGLFFCAPFVEITIFRKTLVESV